jgi:hypothetical protein
MASLGDCLLDVSKITVSGWPRIGTRPGKRSRLARRAMMGTVCSRPARSSGPAQQHLYAGRLSRLPGRHADQSSGAGRAENDQGDGDSAGSDGAGQTSEQAAVPLPSDKSPDVTRPQQTKSDQRNLLEDLVAPPPAPVGMPLASRRSLQYRARQRGAGPRQGRPMTLTLSVLWRKYTVELQVERGVVSRTVEA